MSLYALSNPDSYEFQYNGKLQWKVKEEYTGSEATSRAVLYQATPFVKAVVYFKYLLLRSKKSLIEENNKNEEIALELKLLQDKILTRKAQLELSVLNARLQILKNKKLVLVKKGELEEKQQTLIETITNDVATTDEVGSEEW